MASEEGSWINTDDRPLIEFGFARNAGRKGLFSIANLRRLAVLRGEHRPPGLEGMNWEQVADLAGARSVAMSGKPPKPRGLPPGPKARTLARRAYADELLVEACDHWFSQQQPPRSDIDLLLVVECLAETAQPQARDLLPALAPRRPVEAAAISARSLARTGKLKEAAGELQRALVAFRDDPWVHTNVMARALDLSVELSRSSPALGPALFEALSQPFAARILDESRKDVRLQVALAVRSTAMCVEAFTAFEPWTPWHQGFLRQRCSCYTAAGHELAGEACEQLGEWLARAPAQLEAGLLP